MWGRFAPFKHVGLSGWRACLESWDVSLSPSSASKSPQNPEAAPHTPQDTHTHPSRHPQTPLSPPEAGSRARAPRGHHPNSYNQQPRQDFKLTQLSCEGKKTQNENKLTCLHRSCSNTQPHARTRWRVPRRSSRLRCHPPQAWHPPGNARRGVPGCAHRWGPKCALGPTTRWPPT